MRYPIFILPLAVFCIGSMFAENATGGQSATNSPSVNYTATMRAARTWNNIPIIDIAFTNLWPTPYITNSMRYQVYKASGTNLLPIATKAVPVGASTPSNGLDYYPGVALIGRFTGSNVVKFNFTCPLTNIVSVTNSTLQFSNASFDKMTVTNVSLVPNVVTATNIINPDTNTINVPVLNTNANLSWNLWGITLQLQPLGASSASGNNGAGLGLQYDLDYQIEAWHNDPTDISFYRFNIESKGQFPFSSGSSTSNSIQDSLTFEADGEYVLNRYWTDFLDRSDTLGNVYPLGLSVSPVGFEYNKEFTLGNYTPSISIGGALPFSDYPARIWRKFAQTIDLACTNGSSTPTLFTGIAYISPTTGTASNTQAAAVRERWDTEFIYDLPLCNFASFRFTWNSYVGVNRELWARYYQIGFILPPGNGQSGIFVGYCSGEQPPKYTHTGAWQIGYNAIF